MKSNGRHQGVVLHPLVWVGAIVAPILVFVFTQLDFVQNAEGWFLRGITSWDLGKKEIVADIFAPVWIISIIVVAALTRRLLDRHGGDPDHRAETGIEGQVLSGSRARVLTWIV